MGPPQSRPVDVSTRFVAGGNGYCSHLQGPAFGAGFLRSGPVGRRSGAERHQPEAVHYGRIRADLEHKGKRIGANDLWMAAQARALGSVLVTDNVREFSRVDTLVVENWLR